MSELHALSELLPFLREGRSYNPEERSWAFAQTSWNPRWSRSSIWASGGQIVSARYPTSSHWACRGSSPGPALATHPSVTPAHVWRVVQAACLRSVQLLRLGGTLDQILLPWLWKGPRSSTLNERKTRSLSRCRYRGSGNGGVRYTSRFQKSKYPFRSENNNARMLNVNIRDDPRKGFFSISLVLSI